MTLADIEKICKDVNDALLDKYFLKTGKKFHSLCIYASIYYAASKNVRAVKIV